MVYSTNIEARFLIGIRWDGRLFKEPVAKGTTIMSNPYQYCLDRQWRRIEYVGRDWKRRRLVDNPHAIVLGYGYRPQPDPGPIPDWELERQAKEKAYAEKQAAERAAQYDDYF